MELGDATTTAVLSSSNMAPGPSSRPASTAVAFVGEQIEVQLPTKPGQQQQRQHHHPDLGSSAAAAAAAAGHNDHNDKDATVVPRVLLSNFSVAVNTTRTVRIVLAIGNSSEVAVALASELAETFDTQWTEAAAKWSARWQGAFDPVDSDFSGSVSYTHLTLPTIYSV